jgi:signal transduction histidine kinase/DNA-binding response OmpR family regulator
VRDVIIHKAVFDAGDGTAKGVVGQILDVTEQKRAEAAARKAAAVKGEFLANMSHELRTPMNGVVGMTSLLLDTDLDTEQSEFVAAIRTSGETLMAVIDDILDFSKLEARKLEIETLPFSLRSCIEDSIDVVAYAAAKKGLDLAYAVDHDLPDNYVGDAARIRQILNNLLSNACKFTETGEILVSVDAAACSPDDGGSGDRSDGSRRLQISVHDTGIGIPKNRRHRLFQSFSQVDNSTTRRFGGTGLGLAISKELARLMGGDLSATSTVGEGSTFSLTIDLPLATDQTPLRYQQGFDTDLADTHVLVVDGNKTSRRILHKQLSAWGMSPVVVGSGMEALTSMSTGSDFDVAILDMQLQLMDGTTLARCLRALRPAMPMALLSSIDTISQSDHDLFALRLTKPVKPTALFDALVRLFDEGAAIEPVPSENNVAPAAPADGALRILMAEDNVVNQQVAVGLLRRLGYEIDVVADGLQAVEAATRAAYDVVLMDLHMPELGGSAAAERIREAAHDHEPWIVALTADVMEGTREACLAAGMDDFVTKPLNRRALTEALARVPSRQKGDL